MLHGKKAVAEGIVYGAFEFIEKNVEKSKFLYKNVENSKCLGTPDKFQPGQINWDKIMDLKKKKYLV